MSVGVVYRADKDNRSRLGALPLPDECGGFEAIHAGHVHVEEDDGEVLLQKATQSLAAGPGADKILAQVCQDRLVREQLVGAIVDDQDVDLLVGGSGPVALDWKRHLTVNPVTQEREQSLSFDRLCDVVARACIDALFTVAFHCLGGEGNDRQLLESIHLSDRLDRLIAIHFRQHDIH